jgi:hypothetical protein
LIKVEILAVPLAFSMAAFEWRWRPGQRMPLFDLMRTCF